MKTYRRLLAILCAVMAVLFMQCSSPATEENKTISHLQSDKSKEFNGYESQEKWGEHLVLITGCNDCHTPKKMTDKGPTFDWDLMLSGHPAKIPAPDVDRKINESKGLVTTQTLTSWVGPWGVSFAANLTSDATGIGNWQFNNFLTAIRHGKFKGIESGRDLLPPMPWDMYKNMTDEELQAVFAFLKSTKPIQNVVPDPLPPVLASASK